MATLTPKLSRLVNGDALDCVSGALSLTVKETAVLAQLLMDGPADSETFSRKRLLNAYTQVSEQKQAIKVLSKIIANEKEDDNTRLAAVASLGRMSDPAAEKALIAALNKSSHLLKREVIKALGKLGSKAALEALSATSKDDFLLEKSLHFSETLIRYRQGIADDDLPEIRKKWDLSWQTAAFEPATTATVSCLVEALGDKPYGIALNREKGFAVKCGGIENYLLMNQLFSLEKLPTQLTESSYIAGLVVLKSTLENRPVIRHIILTAPTDTGIDVIIARPNGEVAYTGQLSPGADRLTIDLQNISTTGAATLINGALSASHFNLTVSSLKKRRARPGHRIN